MSSVRETSERLVYSVASDDKRYLGKRYRVDLLANRGGGGCSCDDFAIRRQAAINQAMPLWTSETTCKHVRRAGHYFMVQTLATIAKQVEAGG